MTFDQYVEWIGTPENLAREVLASIPIPRRNESASFRRANEAKQFHAPQGDAIRCLAAQGHGPAKVLVLSEDWSSDCQRDVPTLARVAEAGNMELRIFNRDTDPDIMDEFLNEKRGQKFRSIPVAVFYTKNFDYLYCYTEYPAIYDKDRVVVGHIRTPRPGESPADARTRAAREFVALQASPFFRVWACAAVDEINSGLHRRLVLGEVETHRPAHESDSRGGVIPTM